MSGYFNEYIKVAPFSHALWRDSEAQIFANIDLQEPMLDIGCGFGEFGKIFFSKIVDTGLDISEKDLEKARKSGVYQKTVLADARTLPFENNSFKSCISVSVLEHIEHPEKVINEVYRVLEESGTFVFSVPTATLNNNLIGIRALEKLGAKDLAKK